MLKRFFPVWLCNKFVSVGTWCFLALCCEYFSTPLAIDGLLRRLISSNLLHFLKILPNRLISHSLSSV